VRNARAGLLVPVAASPTGVLKCSLRLERSARREPYSRGGPGVPAAVAASLGRLLVDRPGTDGRGQRLVCGSARILRHLAKTRSARPTFARRLRRWTRVQLPPAAGPALPPRPAPGPRRHGHGCTRRSTPRLDRRVAVNGHPRGPAWERVRRRAVPASRPALAATLLAPKRRERSTTSASRGETPRLPGDGAPALASRCATNLRGAAAPRARPARSRSCVIWPPLLMRPTPGTSWHRDLKPENVFLAGDAREPG